MEFIRTPLADAYIIKPNILSDSRGWFSRLYCKDEYLEIGSSVNWVQFNNSFTYEKGSVRGMHFQLEPFVETKLVRCISGSIYDVIIDLRAGSTTFLQWFGAELSSDNRIMMYIPKGFAHGFQTLTDNCELFYAHSAFYKPGFEGALKYDDPTVNISWPLPVTEISVKDSRHPFLTKEFKGLNII